MLKKVGAMKLILYLWYEMTKKEFLWISRRSTETYEMTKKEFPRIRKDGPP